ncbi:MAG: cytochrome b [Beijerinckiaceae bacterium]
MAWLNDGRSYGRLTKALHWIVVVLFALQLTGGLIMTRLPAGGSAFGVSGDGFYNWHKSLGLVALAIAVLRLWARRAGSLPPWAPTLSPREQALIHRYEQLFYAAMFVMPVSGFIYVMAGGYGVLLFGKWPLPNPIGEWKALAFVARWTHVLAAITLGLAIVAHVGLVLRHQIVMRDGLLRRML